MIGSTRGHATIALDNPKSGVNVGGAMRAAGVYGGDMIVLGGVRPERYMKHPCDTIKAWKHIPTMMVEHVLDALPYNTVPVAIDILDDAESLVDFKHPERAFYIFGAEDETLGKRITDYCTYKVYVPTSHCMNLAATVNVLLYDRKAKQLRV